MFIDSNSANASANRYKNQISNLPDLVCFCLCALGLKVENLRHVVPRENMVAATNTLVKSEVLHQLAQVAEGNVRVRCSAQNPL